jgi:hypothetical protein
LLTWALRTAAAAAAEIHVRGGRRARAGGATLLPVGSAARRRGEGGLEAAPGGRTTSRHEVILSGFGAVHCLATQGGERPGKDVLAGHAPRRRPKGQPGLLLRPATVRSPPPPPAPGLRATKSVPQPSLCRADRALLRQLPADPTHAARPQVQCTSSPFLACSRASPALPCSYGGGVTFCQRGLSGVGWVRGGRALQSCTASASLTSRAPSRQRQRSRRRSRATLTCRQ